MAGEDTAKVERELNGLIAEAERFGDSGSAGPVPPENGPGRVDAREPLGEVFRVIYEAVFGWFLPAWQVTEQEVDKLGTAAGQLLAKWLPRAWLGLVSGDGDGGGINIELRFLRAHVAVITPRLRRGGKAPAGGQVQQQAARTPQPQQSAKDASGDDMVVIGGRAGADQPQ